MPGPWTGATPLFTISNPNPAFQPIIIRTEASSLSSLPSPKDGKSGCSTLLDEGADPMDGSRGKNLKAKIDDRARGCENTPIKFDNAIYEAVQKNDPPKWVHRADKPGSCKKSINGKLLLADPNTYEYLDMGAELTACYKAAKDNHELKDDEWLVVYIKDNYGTNISTGPKAITEGKYVIIYELTPNIANQPMLILPETSSGVEVMLYLPKGHQSNSGFIKLNQGALFNYFVFSDGDITQFDTGGGSNKLSGHIFMNNCSTMNTMTAQGQSYFSTIGNADLVKDLMEKGILCKYNKHCDFTDGGSSDSGSDGSSSSGDGGSSSSGNVKTYYDTHYVPVASRLSVTIDSKEITKERIPTSSDSKTIAPSILVMPRVIRLAQNQVTSVDDLKKYYTLSYLNPSSSSASATTTLTYECKDIDFASEGLYTCTFSRADITDFYVVVGKSTALTTGSSSSGTNDGSSSASGPNLTCEGLALVPNSTQITQPTVKCNGETMNTGSFDYIGAPNSWTNPANGEYNISVKAKSGPCNDKTALCGKVTVQAGGSGDTYCRLVKNGQEVDNITVTHNEKFKAIAKCKGQQENSPSFEPSANVPNGGSLQSNGEAWYTSSQSEGTYLISATFNCPTAQTQTCGTVKLQKASAGSAITISSNMTIPEGTYTVSNNKSCQGGACSSGNCTTTGIGGSCAASPGYSCSDFQFTAESTITISGGSLNLHYCP